MSCNWAGGERDSTIRSAAICGCQARCGHGFLYVSPGTFHFDPSDTPKQLALSSTESIMPEESPALTITRPLWRQASATSHASSKLRPLRDCSAALRSMRPAERPRISRSSSVWMLESCGDAFSALERSDNMRYMFCAAQLQVASGLKAPQCGKHMVVEKPAAPSYAEAVGLARSQSAISLPLVGTTAGSSFAAAAPSLRPRSVAIC